MTKNAHDAATSTLHLPRILCLHGGGVNGQIFETQCRAISARLKSDLRFVFMDGPFFSAPHPSIVPVYGDAGPFRRWLRWEPEHPEIDGEEAAAEIRYLCRQAMNGDAGTGEWVGILGFSQGAKIAASILWTQEKVTEKFGAAEATPFKFGVLMAGRGPIVLLDDRLDAPRYAVDAGHLSTNFSDWPDSNTGPHAFSIPTLHIHGTRDPGLELHRILLNKFCKPGTTGLVEWDGGHRIPIKIPDVEAVASAILALAKDSA